jgi:2-amino-4-hydroxy-6-hydroxymethyldihydropteridine diphosphokinase
MYVIRLKNCAFFARHGVHDEEKTLGQRFYVDAELALDAGGALEADSLKGTVDYGAAFQVIEEIVTGERRRLIEALALEVRAPFAGAFRKSSGQRSRYASQMRRSPASWIMSRRRLSGRSEARAFLGLGGNIGDPERSMTRALTALDAAAGTRVAAVSRLYRTPPWGKTDQPDFLNSAAELHTTLEPRPLLELCLDIERSLKRVRRERWGPRIVDLDILAYGDVELVEEGLVIPHPRMIERAFVMVPLADIAPDLAIGGRTVAEQLATLDATDVEPLTRDGTWWMTT